MDPSDLSRLLDRMIPFRYLEAPAKEALVRQARARSAPAGEVLFRHGERSREVYLIEDGLVEQRWPGNSGPEDTLVRPGHYVGERAALLDLPRTSEALTREASRLWVLPGETFLELVRSSPAVAQAFSAILRDKHGLFEALSRFSTEVRRGLGHGYWNLPFLVELYRQCRPALHGGLEDEAPDLHALGYALRRLPANVTRTFAWHLTDDLPPQFRQPQAWFPAVPSAARRRAVWQILPGKNLVVLRNGISDVLDLISNLCLYVIEARKLRRLFTRPEELAPLHQRQIPRTLDEAQAEGLQSFWGSDLPTRLWELTLHSDEFHLTSVRQFTNYNSARAETWAAQIAAAVRRLTGFDPAELPESWDVHLISSNTHSVSNCLNPRLGALESEVWAWAQAVKHPLAGHPWAVPRDGFYALLPAYWAAGGRQPAPEPAILTLEDTAFTGIVVQLLDLSRLDCPGRDPLLPGTCSRPALLVNIDYAFGEQADDILRNLILLFQRRVRSINVLGKAGALVGRRGDILVPTALIHQATDQILPVPAWDGAGAWRGFAGGLHRGPLATVEGTLVQNRDLLQFSRNLWGCVGLEMEGSFYARQVQESRHRGLLGAEVAERYAYYVSDLPLEAEASLARSLSPGEGIPALYAVTRAILGAILTEPEGSDGR